MLPKKQNKRKTWQEHIYIKHTHLYRVQYMCSCTTLKCHEMTYGIKTGRLCLWSWDSDGDCCAQFSTNFPQSDNFPDGRMMEFLMNRSDKDKPHLYNTNKRKTKSSLCWYKAMVINTLSNCQNIVNCKQCLDVAFESYWNMNSMLRFHTDDNRG